MVIHDVQVINKNGIFDPDNGYPVRVSMDDIFNSPVNIIVNNTGMFIQDDYPGFGLGAELSRNSFVIYDKASFDKMDAPERFVYLDELERIYINPYTGTIIKTKK